MKWCKFIIAVVAAVILSGCDQAYRDISLTSARIVSVVPQGLTSVAATVEVGVHNPAGDFVLSDILAKVRLDGSDVIDVTAEQVFVQGRTDRTYTIPLSGRLADSFSPLRLLGLLNGTAPADNITVSVTAVVSKNGKRGKVIELEEIPLRNLMKKQ